MNRNAILTLFVIIATWTTIGCSPGGAVYVDSRFTPEERTEIQAAADMWTAVGAPIDLIWDAHVNGWDDGNRRVLVREGHRGAVNLDRTFETPCTDGTTLRGRIIIDMDRVAETGDTLVSVVTHEMGHMLGLEHVGTAETAIMAAQRDDSTPLSLTTVDIAELCRATGMGCSRPDR